MRRHPVSLKPQVDTVDKPLLLAVLFLVVFGIAMVFDASATEAAGSFGDKYFFLKRQAVWAGIGTVTLFVFSYIRYTFWQKVAVVFFSVTIVLLVLVLIPPIGIEALGASRRISLGAVGVGVQPSEIAKLSLVILLSSLFVRRVSILRFVVPTALVAGLVVAEPDLGTTLIAVGSALALYWTAGAPVLHIFILGGVAGAGAFAFALTSAYRRARIAAFLDPNFDPINASYHIRQILIALGSGGLFGLGLGQSRQKHLFLPEPATDSIFAIIAEEFGFFGALLLLAIFGFIIARGLQIGWKCPDNFGKFLAVGITSWIGIGTIVNLSAMVAAVPLTGVPLPFVSYGGSSLVVLLAAVGILLNISKYQKVAR